MKMWLAMQDCISQITILELFITEAAEEPLAYLCLERKKTFLPETSRYLRVRFSLRDPALSTTCRRKHVTETASATSCRILVDLSSRFMDV
jgi:hypothetical protein